MISIANIKLWDELVGVISWDNSKKVAFFEYDKKYLQNGFDIGPLYMPIDKAKQNNTIFTFPNLPIESFKGLPGVISDSLPDKFGTILIEEYLKSQGRDIASLNSVEMLCFIGKRGMGALEYEPSIPFKSDPSIKIEVDQMVKVINEILSNKSKIDISLQHYDAISKIIQIGTSAGGARPKAIIAYNPEKQEVRSGQVDAPEGFGHWIIKFDGIKPESTNGSPKGYGRVEYAYYKMAKDCGIEMNDCLLLQEDRLAHFLTKRFDRLPGNGKLHMVSLCGLAHYDFNSPNLYSYENVFRILREMRLPYLQMEQLYTRMVFNDLAKNFDDHTKNISFLMDKTGKWSLAPAYDLSFAYQPGNYWVGNHQLSINGKREGIELKDFLQVAKAVDIKKPNEIIEKVCDSLSNWKKYAVDARVDKEHQSHIEKIINTNIGLMSSPSITGNKIPSVDSIKGNGKDKGISI